MDMDMNILFEDINIGKECEVFGSKFTITQTGRVLILSNPDWVLTLLELEPPVEEGLWGHMIVDPSDLRVNHEIDIFLQDKKQVRITSTDRIEENGVTFKCIFKFLKLEWGFISQLVDTKFPFEYNEEFDLLVFNDEWDLIGDIDLLREGSFSRYDSTGRCI